MFLLFRIKKETGLFLLWLTNTRDLENCRITNETLTLERFIKQTNKNFR